MKNKSLLQLIEKLKGQVALISEDRLKLLRLVGDLIKESIAKNKIAKIVVVCTHNSRRSQLAEAWIVAACQYYGIDTIEAYSGGTEATAFNLRMVVALRQSAFHLHTDGPRNNPFYTLQAVEKAKSPHIMYSKIYDHPSNPRENFMTFMVCDHADQNCPVILGAEHRISLPYLDPKEYDDTPMENQMYLEKVEEIGREMIFLMGEVSRG